MSRKEGTGARVGTPTAWEKILFRCDEVGECLLWSGPVSKGGFPRMYFGGENQNLRSFIYRNVMGKLVPHGCNISTACKNRRCVAWNCLVPKRLETIRRDCAAMIKADPITFNRQRQAAHIAGHAKLDMERATEIRSSSISTRELAEQYGVSVWSISAIKRGATYAPGVVATSIFNYAGTL